MPRAKTTKTAVAPAPAGETTVDVALVDQVAAELNHIHATSTLATARAVGELLVTRFFGGDAARFHERGKGHASFRQLGERDDLAFSYSFLWNACAVVEQLRLLPPDLRDALPLSHHRLLLTVKDPEVKEKLAREAVAQGLSKRALEAAVKDGRPEVAPESRPGRRPLPAFVKGLTRLRAAVALAGSEEVAGAVAKMEKDKARELLGELDAQMAALGRLRAQVEAAVG